MPSVAATRAICLRSSELNCPHSLDTHGRTSADCGNRNMSATTNKLFMPLLVSESIRVADDPAVRRSTQYDGLIRSSRNFDHDVRCCWRLRQTVDPDDWCTALDSFRAVQRDRWRCANEIDQRDQFVICEIAADN